MSKENFFETVETDVFIDEVGEFIFLKTEEEKPLKDALKSLMKGSDCMGDIEDVNKKPKRSIISFGSKKSEKKIVDVFIVSSSFKFFSDEVTFFENEMIEVLSYGRTEFFDFRVKFVHISFQDVTKIFKKIKGDKVVVLFLSDVEEKEMVNSLDLIKNHSQFEKEKFYHFYQNDKDLKFFEYRLDFFFNFVKYEIQT